MRLLPVVEGAGDVAAAPELIRRTLQEQKRFDVRLLRPYRVGDIHVTKKKLPNLMRSFAKEQANILWILDGDDGCAVEHATELKRLVPSDCRSIPLEFCFLVREYESLFLADIDTTRSALGIAKPVPLPADLESLRGVKEFLSKHMPRGKTYKETVDQVRLTSKLDLGIVRKRSRSFRHLESALLRITDNV